MSSVEIIQTDEQTHHIFWAQVQLLFLLFPDRRTLKFLKVKCNQKTL